MGYDLQRIANEATQHTGERMARFRAAKTIAPRYEGEVIGLPDSAMVFTNSERKSAWCQRRWYYSQGVGIGNRGSIAMYFGSWVHRAMEAAFTYYMYVDEPLPEDWESICPLCDGTQTFKDEECMSCDGTGAGVVDIAIQLMREALDDEMEWPEQEQRLHDVITGYFINYGKMPFKNYKVVGVEMQVAFPVLSPKTGRVYRSETYVVPTEEGWRIAQANDSPDDCELVSLPWYQCAKMDGVLQNRKTGGLWVHEFKTSQNPVTFGKDLALDTQIAGYMRALNYVVSLGYFDKNLAVEGYFWDVLGSRKHTKPKVLKSGKVSMAKNQRIASWHWNEMLDSRPSDSDGYDERLEMEDFAVQLAERVDPTLYHREFGSYTVEGDNRYAVELFADAKRFSKMRRDVVRVNVGEEVEIAEAFPRTPVCRISGHGCAYTGPCMNTDMNIEQSFEQRPHLVWIRAATLNKKEEICQPMF